MLVVQVVTNWSPSNSVRSGFIGLCQGFLGISLFQLLGEKKGRYVAPTDENVSRRFTYSGRVDDLHFGEVEVSASI